VAGGELDVTELDSGTESGHDEGGSQHVGVHQPKAGTLAD
jgi:hypothetical protein